MELRQLRYFVALAEELHFGGLAAREHIVQSALSQQLQRLERELGLRLLERTTHHVQLTPAGGAFLVEARQILAHVDRAAVAAQRAAGSAPTLRVGIVDASYDSMPQILGESRRYPDLEIHEGRGGRAGAVQHAGGRPTGRGDLGGFVAAPTEVAAELFRLDPLAVPVPDSHRLGGCRRYRSPPWHGAAAVRRRRNGRRSSTSSWSSRAAQWASRRPCTGDSVGKHPAAADLVKQGRCVVCAPGSCRSAVPEVVWRPLVQPVPRSVVRARGGAMTVPSRCMPS